MQWNESSKKPVVIIESEPPRLQRFREALNSAGIPYDCYRNYRQALENHQLNPALLVILPEDPAGNSPEQLIKEFHQVNPLNKLILIAGDLENASISLIRGQVFACLEAGTELDFFLCTVYQALSQGLLEENRLLKKQIEDLNKEQEEANNTISHDLRSSLVNVEGFTHELEKLFNTLRQQIQQPELQGRLEKDFSAAFVHEITISFQYINNSIAKMYQLLNNLMLLSRIGHKELHPDQVDVTQLVAGIWAVYQSPLQSKHPQFQAEELLPCLGDYFMLNQLFFHLIDNAVKYSAAGDRSLIKITSRQDLNSIVYCIEDNGIGIDSRYHQKIFNLFFRLDHDLVPGSGLGLCLVKKIVNRHKGTLRVESAEGEGSKFYVTLPAVQ